MLHASAARLERRDDHMSIRCGGCGREYDVTLFQFGQVVRCECGRDIVLSHRVEGESQKKPWYEVRILRTEGVSVIELCGELTYESVAHLEDSLQPVLEPPGVGVLLDFERVTYATSPALNLIVGAWNALEKRGIPMAVCSLHGNVKKVLQVVGLTEHLQVFSSRAAAVKYLLGEP